MIRFVWSRLFRRACSSFVSVKNTDKKQQKGHDKKKHEKTAGEHKE